VSPSLASGGARRPQAPPLPPPVALARIRLARVPRAVALDRFTAAGRSLAGGALPRGSTPPRA
jgi:hypothetical protein